ncbi:MAG: flagellar protein FlgN [Selenomonadaceae bacterium]|nr:flagellar protein FlgN [Selenomonadaceae bacterium]
MWQKLIEVLDKICTVYDKLAKLGERKRDALVAVDMEGLSKILDEEQLIAAQIQKLEQQRGAILQELSKDNPAVNSNTKAEDFYKTAPTQFLTKQLLAIHKKISQNVERTLKIRDHNQILAQSALDAVNSKLNQLSGAFVEPTYGAKGAVVTHQKKFDYKA